MAQRPKHFYEFGAFSIDMANRLLTREGQPVAVTLKAFDTLLALVERRGEVLSKEELMAAVWPDTVVEENNLNQQISTLRRLLADGADGQKYIETIPRRGYRFVAAVKETRREDEPLPPDDAGPLIEPETKTPAVASDPPTSLPEPTATGLRGMTPRRWQALTLAVGLIGIATFIYFWTGKGPAVRSVAVLPFKPLSNEPGDLFLDLGMADTLITKLSAIKKLTVRPTSSIIRYAEAEPDPAEAGRALKVDAVLQGRYLRSGDKIRVSVQLIQVGEGKLLWGETFDEPLTGILRLQDAISERVAAALAFNLTGEERKSLAKRYTENAEAYQLYLKGRYYWYKWTPEGWNKAQEYFTQAIAVDPDYALAYAGLADAYGVMAFVSPLRESARRWKEAALKALELDGSLAEAHIAMSALKLFGEWDRPTAEAEIRRAIELSPNNALAHDIYGIILGTGGQSDQSIQEARHALELDPLSPYMNTDVGMAYYFAHRYDEAIAHLDNALEIDPNHVDAINYLGEIYEQKGLYAQAIAHWQRSLTLTGDEQTARAIAQAYTGSGYAGALREWAERLMEKSKQGYVSPVDFAGLYARLGDKDKAVEYLNRAYLERSIWLVWIRVEPRWASLWSDAPFQELLRKIDGQNNAANIH